MLKHLVCRYSVGQDICRALKHEDGSKMTQVLSYSTKDRSPKTIESEHLSLMLDGQVNDIGNAGTNRQRSR